MSKKKDYDHQLSSQGDEDMDFQKAGENNA